MEKEEKKRVQKSALKKRGKNKDQPRKEYPMVEATHKIFSFNAETKKPQQTCVYFKNLTNALLGYLSRSTYVVGCVAWVTDFKILDCLKQMNGVSIIVQRDSFVMRRYKHDQWRQLLKMKYQALPVFPWMNLAGTFPAHKDTFEKMSKEKMAIRVMGEIQNKQAKQKRRVKFIGLNKKKEAAEDSGSGVSSGVDDGMDTEGGDEEEEDKKFEKKEEKKEAKEVDKTLCPSMLHHKFLVFLDAQGNYIGLWNGSFNLSKNADESAETVMVFEDPRLAKIFFEEFLRLLPHSFPIPI